MAVVTAAAGLPRLGPVRQVRTDVLDVGYVDAGPADGPVALLLHGFPYDVHSYVDVVPQLVAAGMRVVVPYLRGHGRRGSCPTTPCAPDSRLRSALTP